MRGSFRSESLGGVSKRQYLQEATTYVVMYEGDESSPLSGLYKICLQRGC